MEDLLGHEWVASFVKVLVAVLVEHHCRQGDARTALNAHLLAAFDQDLEEFKHELTSVVHTVNDSVQHWFLPYYLFQCLEYVVYSLPLKT